MADMRYQTQVRTQSRAEIDQGLRSYMLGVYNYMSLGVAFTAIVTLAVASSPAAMATVSSLSFVFLIALLALGWFAPRLMLTGSTATAQISYWGYAGLWGLAIAPLVGRYLAIDPGIVFQAFLITAITFGATSLAGYVTKRDLSGFSGFMMMGMIGILVAGLVNAFFVQSSMMSLIVSIVTVVLFAGVTAWETQQIKEMYVEGDAAGVAKGKSIFGAFMLYGSFITIFVNILNILGIMRQN